MKQHHTHDPSQRVMRRLARHAAVFLLLTCGLQSAGATTYTVTSNALCGGDGTFEQAIKDANANPGTDTISFAPPGGWVDVVPCTAVGHVDPLFPFSISATESVDIIGNGSRIHGGQIWFDENGQMNDPQKCPQFLGTNAHWMAMSRGFLEVGTYGSDNLGVAVSITGLNFDNLPMLVKVEKNATFTMTDSTAYDINNFLESCDRPTVFADEGAGVTLRRVTIHHSNLPGAGTSETDTYAMISGGFGGGNLVLDNVRLMVNNAGRAVTWVGGTTKIVSSQFVDSGGMWTDADTTEIVNSAFYSFGSHARDRISTIKGITTITASTFYWGEPVCKDCSLVQGMGFLPGGGGTGTYSFQATAVGAQVYYPNGVPVPNSGPLLIGTSSKYSSDALTWVQETANQSNAALQVILPNVMTSYPALMPDAIQTDFWTDVVTPLLGTVGEPGVLIDVIDCGANPLQNPIDNSSITTDVFGNARCDSNGKRNIGAVQLTLAPYLSLGGSGNGFVDLSWTRPSDPSSGAIDGYTLQYRIKGSGGWTSESISDPTTLSKHLTGLINGSTYEFQIAARNTEGDGPTSNLVEATIAGLPGAPDPLTGTGTPGTQQLLNWVTPPDNGSPITGYVIIYRPLDGTAWTPWPFTGTGTSTTVTGLTTSINYQFAVAAINGIGAGPYSQTLTGPYLPCDVNGNGSVNKADINLINAVRNTNAAVGDVRDQNHDGVINLYDSRQCVLLCNKPLCAL